MAITAVPGEYIVEFKDPRIENYERFVAWIERNNEFAVLKYDASIGYRALVKGPENYFGTPTAGGSFSVPTELSDMLEEVFEHRTGTIKRPGVRKT